MTQSPSEMDATLREKLLMDAADLVANNRNKEYGEPFENLSRTASMFKAYLGERNGHSLEAHDIAVFGIILKLGRLSHNQHKADSWADIAGYAAIGYECMKKGGSVNRLFDFLKDE